MKVLLIGCGNFGKHYLRILNEENKLSAVVTRTSASANKIAKEYKISASTFDFKMLDDCDAVIIATPANTHYDLVKKIIPFKPILCEKPLALTSKHIKDLISTPNKLMVGHIYRFNNAISELKKINKPKEAHIRFLQGQKKGCHVLHEFMHGFDIMLNLFRKGQLIDKVIRMDYEGDVEYAKLTYNCGVKVILELGFQSKEKARDITYIFDDKKIYCDLVKQEIEGISYYVEPLRLEIRRFFDILKQDLYYPDASSALEIEELIEEVMLYT